MEKPDIYSIVGKLYVDVYTAQQIINNLQTSLNGANNQIQQLTQELSRINELLDKTGSGE